METEHLFGPAIDIWSLGVTLFCLLHGRCPFEDTNNIALNQKIINDEPEISEALSTEAKHLLRVLLLKDPLARITLPDLKVHPWVEMNGAILGTMDNCFEPEVETETIAGTSPKNSKGVSLTCILMYKTIGTFRNNYQKNVARILGYCITLLQL